MMKDDMDLGLLLVRLVGLGIAAHGAQKLFGWFGGHGIAGTGGFFASIGYRPGPLMATLSGLSEFVGGLLIVLGLGGPIAALLLLGGMIPAIGVHWPKYFVDRQGFETPLLWAAFAAAFAFFGYGAYSLDAVLALGPLWTPAIVWGAIALGIVGGLGAVAMRRREPQPDGGSG